MTLDPHLIQGVRERLPPFDHALQRVSFQPVGVKDLYSLYSLMRLTGTMLIRFLRFLVENWPRGQQAKLNPWYHRGMSNKDHVFYYAGVRAKYRVYDRWDDDGNVWFVVDGEDITKESRDLHAALSEWTQAFMASFSSRVERIKYPLSQEEYLLMES